MAKNDAMFDETELANREIIPLTDKLNAIAMKHNIPMVVSIVYRTYDGGFYSTDLYHLPGGMRTPLKTRLLGELLGSATAEEFLEKIMGATDETQD